MTKRLCTFAFDQMTMVLAFDRERPDDIFMWNIPEGVDGEWGFNLIHTWHRIPGAKWVENDNRLTMATDYTKGFPSMGAFTTDITIHEEYMEGRIRVKNGRNHIVRGVSPCVCLGFNKAKNFYPAALERTYISMGGKLTRLSETERGRSLDGVMPVYAVRGSEGPDRWRERVDNGYGWGLSDDVADNGFVGLESIDGAWSAGTFFKDAYCIFFNARPPWHGCVHSEPFLGTLEPDEEKEAVGRAYILKGDIECLHKKFLSFESAQILQGTRDYA